MARKRRNCEVIQKVFESMTSKSVRPLTKDVQKGFEKSDIKSPKLTENGQFGLSYVQMHFKRQNL